MNWKPSKRQAVLKSRLANSSKVYWQTSQELDQMLLKMLHRRGIYTPDDLHNRYLKSNGLLNINKINRRPARLSQINQPNQEIDRALVHLSSAVSQLKDILHKQYSLK